MPKKRQLMIGNVSIKQVVKDDKLIELKVEVEGGDSDVAIDTMLLAILQICSGAGIEPKDVIVRTAFRMKELSTTLVCDKDGAQA